MSEPEPLSAEEMAAELRRFAETAQGANGVRSIRYDLHGAAPRTAPVEVGEGISGAAAQKVIPEPGRGEQFAWLCQRCGYKLTNSQIGKEFAASAYQHERRRMAACPRCQGVAFNIDDDLRIKDAAAREAAEKARQGKREMIYFAAAALFFLALPACFGFLVLVMTTILFGPFGRLDTRGNMSALLLAGSCTFLLSWLGAGFIVPGNWLLGYAMFIPCYAGIVLASPVISWVARKIGDGVGDVIYRR